jgi:glutaredoxin 3
MAKVIMYTLETCPYCMRAKAHYNQNNIPFEEREVYTNQQWLMDASILNPKGTVPIIVTFEDNGQENASIGWDGKAG